jgi:hypothetical protein
VRLLQRVSLLIPLVLTYSSVAPNVEFYIDDIEDDWGFEKDPFDYVHARFLTGAILNWPRLVKQAFE